MSQRCQDCGVYVDVPEQEPCKLCAALELAIKSRDAEIADLRRRLQYLLGEEL